MGNSGIEVLSQGRNFLRLLEGLWVSMSIALAAMALSIVFGVLLGIVMTSKNRAVRLITRTYLEFVRVMPQLVLLFIVYFTLSTEYGINLGGRTAAIVVFALWGTAEMGDLVRGAVQSIPAHQTSSALALGMSRAQVNRYVILPQTVRRLVPLTINLTNRMIMTTSIVVIIGVTEVLKTGQQIIDANRFEYPDAALWVYGVVFLMYFTVCYSISLLSRYLERKWQK
ncbi:MAG: amino acid ABC transporter permease [Actinomycetaceae bacterium]|nr:amino acid ABC transporter permease [Actinomycetaceae bacterium]